ncbi:alpha/beta fold hydrolase [Schauerella aestuarii]|uniref:alpha/beta fold hydrolase n=1 Tax=Schauerella aestuarii TaxID=2511204 RepID=UPI001F1D06F5|nr:alpha/beta hydrolase [Achromobacter aestuarii]
MFTLAHRRAMLAFVLLAALIITATASAATTSVPTKSYTVNSPDGVELAVQEAGNPNGPAIIFVHGLLGSHLNWEKQLASPQLQRYRLITYDMRGHGLSGKPAVAAAYSDGKRWAEDLNAVIAASKASRPVLVGWSLGGAVITNYLASFGDDRIAGAMYVGGVIELNADQIVSHPAIYRDLVSPDLKTHLDAVREFLSLCFQTQPDSTTFMRLYANAAMASWTMQKAVQSMSIASDGLSKARVPMLMVYGEQDALVHARPSLARAQVLNPKVRGEVFAKSGHAPFIEEAERFNQVLAGFAATTFGQAASRQ